MLFSSPLFLFLFQPFSVLTYFAFPFAWRNLILLGLSILFYSWGEPRFVFVLLVMAALDWWLAERIARHDAMAWWWLSCGVIANLSLLFFFKYADFALHVLQPLVGTLPHLALTLPIGISFFVFEKITYLVDIYRGTGKAAAKFTDYLLFVFFFPKMLAGPIIKYHEIESALRARTSSWDDRTAGFLRFLWGLARKVLIADTCGELVDEAFALPHGGMGFSTAWLALLAFTTQIYFDFAGYSDMAIGLARIFGFRLRENFDNPYGAASFTEFWRRWHISLTSWIREYLYVPLGGNRDGTARTYANLWICFLLSGLWHGAAWNFVLWGAWNGLFLVADRVFLLKVSARFPRFISVGVTLFLVMLGWGLFRSRSLAQLQELFTALFSPGLTGQFVRIPEDQLAAIVIGLVGALVAATGPMKIIATRTADSRVARAAVACVVCLLGSLAVAKAVTVTFNPFLYFRF